VNICHYAKPQNVVLFFLRNSNKSNIMNLRITIIILVFANSVLTAQVKMTSNNVFTAKEFSKDIAMYYSKKYLFKDILGTSEVIDEFEVIPLAAASSGELTTLLYK